ncbi:MAG: transcription antitermination factor NusB [Terriglobales bacterium]
MSTRRHRPIMDGREAALQMIYAVDLGGQGAATVAHWYLQAHPLTEEAAALASALLEAVGDRKDEIEAVIERHAIGWRLVRMSAVDRSLLKLAVAELLLHPRASARTVIQAAARLAHKYSQPEAEAFVRGLLEAVARELASEPEVIRHAQ